MSQTPPTNDPVYKRLYTFREMVADLLRSLFPADLIAAVDLRSLHRLPAEYVGDDFRQRRGDAVWRARVRGPGAGWLHVLVLLEFQSTGDREMALRVLEYTAMLYRELLRAREGTGRSGPLPAVLPVVLYNGESRWSAARDVSGLVEAVGPGLAPYQPRQRYAVLDERHAEADDLGPLTRAVALLEQSRSAADLARVAGRLAEWLGGPGRSELRRAFTDWLWTLWRRLERRSEEPGAPPEELTLEEIKMTLEERVSRWPEPYIRQGIEQGMQRGVAEGVQRGLARQRALLRRQAEARFGAETAERLFASLRQVEDQDRLDEIAEALVLCETGTELLRRTDA